MNKNLSNTWLRIAAAASFLLVPAMAKASCTYSVSTPSVAMPHAGGTFSVQVNTQPNCSWSVGAATGWVSVLAGRTGKGSGVITIYVAPNNSRSRSTVISGIANVLPTSDGTIGGRSSGGIYRAFAISLLEY